MFLTRSDGSSSSNGGGGGGDSYTALTAHQFKDEVLLGTRDGRVVLWDLRMARVVHEARVHDGRVTSVGNCVLYYIVLHSTAFYFALITCVYKLVSLFIFFLSFLFVCFFAERSV